MDIGPIILLVVVIVIAIGAVALVWLYADYARRRVKGGPAQRDQVAPRATPLVPPPLPPQPPASIQFGEAPQVRPGKIRWGDDLAANPVARTEVLQTGRFTHCPICRQAITPVDVQNGRVTVCRNPRCKTQYHTDCLSYTNNVCQICGRG